MVVCQFFLRGTCKFGDQCRNEHPQNAQTDRRSAFGGSTWTPTNAPKTLPYSLETMAKDFDVKADKPSWPLSSYGPAKNEKNLLPPLDESPEELRLKAVTAMRNGNINEYLQHEQNGFANAEQVFTNARNDIKGAFEAAKRNSLGNDVSNSTTVTPVSGSNSAFGAANASAFGQPSAFGAQSSSSTSPFGQQQGTSSFGTSAFGAPAFGQTPTFGQSPIVKPPFGGAGVNNGGFSAFAGPGPSAFAASTSNPPPSSGSVFGQSAFSGSSGGAQPGQSAFGPANSVSTNSAFGRPNAFSPTSGSGFGPTSSFGVPNNAASAFGQHAPSLAPAFGPASTSSTSPTVSPFAQPVPNTSTFGQPTSAFGQPTAATSAFSPNATTIPFGQSTSAFGTRAPAQQSAFGQAPLPVSPSGSKPHAKSAVPDFANAKSTYKPGLNPYDALLPTNYSSLLPDNVRAAFMAPRFSWDNVPDWLPPLDMR